LPVGTLSALGFYQLITVDLLSCAFDLALSHDVAIASNIEFALGMGARNDPYHS
jgi:hypothetical protein